MTNEEINKLMAVEVMGYTLLEGYEGKIYRSTEGD